MTKYSGSEWLIREKPNIQISPLGLKVADLLGQVFRGLYHIADAVRRTDWTQSGYIKLTIRRSLSTFDSSDLTELVVLAHDMNIRIEISGRSKGMLELSFMDAADMTRLIAKQPNMESQMARIRHDLALPNKDDGPCPYTNTHAAHSRCNHCGLTHPLVQAGEAGR